MSRASGILFVLVLALSAARVSAREQGNGAITGLVTDASGAPVPGATVSL